MKTNTFFKMGYKAFRVKDVNKDGYSLSCEVFPDVIYIGKDGIKVFDHSLQTVELHEKCRWARGWRKARNEYVKRKNCSVDEIRTRLKQCFRQLKLRIDPKFTNDLYMQFRYGSKGKFNVKF